MIGVESGRSGAAIQFVFLGWACFFAWAFGILLVHLSWGCLHQTLGGVGAFLAWIGWVGLLLGSFSVGAFGISLFIWYLGVCGLISLAHFA